MKVVKNGRILYENRLIEAEIGIENGKITNIKKIGLKGEEIDATGCIVLPAGIDVHVHFRDFKEKHKEDWETGSKAAAAGGVTTVFDHPNTNPPIKTKEAFDKKKKRAEKKSFVDFGINGAATEDSDLKGLAKRGVSAFGEIFYTQRGKLGLPHEKANQILSEINELDKKACIHAEDRGVLKKGKKRFEERDKINYPQSRPKSAETRAINEILKITQKQDLHFCHITTKQGAKIIARTNNTSEITPHHLFFEKKDFEEQGSFLKTNPPIRKSKNRAWLWKLFRANKIDILASDHAPHTLDEKNQEFWKSPSGVPGVQAMYPLMAYQVKRNNLGLSRLIEAISKKPANIFGLNKDSIREGRDADLVLMDFNEIEKIDKNKMHSKCNWTPYQGKEAIFPQKTILRGKVIYKDGVFQDQIGRMID
ncbi:dihydroorotase [archaeon SCG-AAA382B04]|nr:dihydroorotase [archaeon SCG-AAA382B04]